MKKLNRRDFARLTMAAFGGVVAGAALTGCGDDKKSDGGGSGAGPLDPKLLTQEPNICRGLNACKGQGKTKEHECAGASECATTKQHGCATMNDCKGQGGCTAQGRMPGQNACKGQGGCEVPLNSTDHPGVWAATRKNFETQMQLLGKSVLPAPAN